ncbi:2-C-methyl-D-erythritol 4-phosphate cytidylyltransferase [Babesia microti strain RI]|uniref:2-C-methyl-D-erythritol 4-phosphate cytidylyltransferase n=1 Tax=Babesia microti (strain RI) TaxID=1133968 RepID=I7J8N8_BABMR|nr:2-C-methyl-D-erythritol 4-phosphate cytidylyltransferase [Babesia microti strain RI]CCF72954.1 2-C-methyl-D-erythritol 4-phosphate cytidylyltransferase [Babesia microti strain RI]|eukprot:XP_012647563.1 2-C-methyl-D-erythritol 4-phosphate cytidylyltransferase [Babesia microti strain RI]
MRPHFPLSSTYVFLYFTACITANESLFLNPKKSSISVIFTCGGRGLRYQDSGGTGIKQFNCVNNVPIYLFSFYELLKYPNIKHIILATHRNKFTDIFHDLQTRLPLLNGRKADSIQQNPKLFPQNNNHFYYYKERIIVKSDPDWQNIEKLYNKQIPPFTVVKITICDAGTSRKLTVINGLKHLNKDSDIVLIHDSARPLIHTIDLDKMIATACKKGSAVPFIKINDSIKQHLDYKLIENGDVDRDLFVLIQTPQAFKSNLIKCAYETAAEYDMEYPDCSRYVEIYCNKKIYLVPGHQFNMKITTLSDYNIVKHLLIEKYFKTNNQM